MHNILVYRPYIAIKVVDRQTNTIET